VVGGLIDPCLQRRRPDTRTAEILKQLTRVLVGQVLMNDDVDAERV
jgi:hypothetical protein